ncbi:3-isopropylmalate dehydrogenase [Paraburkholderia silviterrae]|nr:3-isopropylmalate dehydrogenase [Paraburkholderia silviterrae]
MLPGDGVGPEIFSALKPVVAWLQSSMDLDVKEAVSGYNAYLAHGVTLPRDTLSLALDSDAVLFGAEDNEAFSTLHPAERPSSALLELRQKLGVFANLRPVRINPSLVSRSPLKPEIISGADFIVVRELLGGLYFGTPRGIETLPDGKRRGVDSLVYFSDEIERVARVAFELARSRRNKLCSVDKGNVLATGALWRDVVSSLGRSEYPDVELSHMYVDNCAMQLVRRPSQFDVIVTENTFGDILSDCAAMIPGSIGMLPSASLSQQDESGRRRGLYEPIHGSAPDIAGKNLANPIGTILSLAMALEHSLGTPELAKRLEQAVEEVLETGKRTSDLGGDGTSGTREMAQAIADRLQA